MRILGYFTASIFLLQYVHGFEVAVAGYLAGVEPSFLVDLLGIPEVAGNVTRYLGQICETDDQTPMENSKTVVILPVTPEKIDKKQLELFIQYNFESLSSIRDYLKNTLLPKAGSAKARPIEIPKTKELTEVVVVDNLAEYINRQKNNMGSANGFLSSNPLANTEVASPIEIIGTQDLSTPDILKDPLQEGQGSFENVLLENVDETHSEPKKIIGKKKKKHLNDNLVVYEETKVKNETLSNTNYIESSVTPETLGSEVSHITANQTNSENNDKSNTLNNSSGSSFDTNFVLTGFFACLFSRIFLN
ncbi:hypothetical protein ROZALSC1DRAFT_30151 [Rozella allomycis CSF55]|uniref:Uncharacterized protein n=1 Tax=Rozella allomycis (strain CSF55) TaxID=988480 RepID=A0A075B2V3_ROZAC|nr:hypothetical protein O9G_000702 [Rozella allomycis CSF55]RKP18120.1 hypothetical protein ROZALSC1DRAFT_30151 [Rozella allomycis CSF55]|eukprot:EPZ35306.1 hypothetical protein O9G_000702 [Rozella allomycis CSF55]